MIYNDAVAAIEGGDGIIIQVEASFFEATHYSETGYRLWECDERGELEPDIYDTLADLLTACEDVAPLTEWQPMVYEDDGFAPAASVSVDYATAAQEWRNVQAQADAQLQDWRI